MKKIITFTLSLLILLIPFQASASVCWTDTHKTYERCMDVLNTTRGSGSKIQSTPSWCAGCNLGWSKEKFNTCDQKAKATWIQRCEEEYKKDECPEHQQKNSKGKCTCSDDTCCKANYGMASTNSNTSTGCHCNKDTQATKQSDGSIKCEWTYEYLNNECKKKYGISIWNQEEQQCQCMEYTELKNGKCEAESAKVLEARQELQYAAYRRILEFASSGFEPAQAAANQLFGISDNSSISVMAADTGANQIAYLNKLSFYQKMSAWPELTTQEAINKAVEILKGKKATIGKINLTIKDSNTVYTGITNTIGFLFSGQVSAYDTGTSKTTIFTPNSINTPKGTKFTVSYDPTTNKTTTSVEEGSVSMISTSTKKTTTINAGQSNSTSENNSNTSSNNSILDSIGYTGARAESSCFKDISGNKFETAICYVKKKGIVKGYSDGTYKPNTPINRAEFTKIIIGTTYENSTISGSNCFSDIKNEWFAKFVCKAKKANIIAGYSDKTFRPQNNINLAEAMKIIIEGAAKTENFEIPNAEGPWYQKYINVANQLELLKTINSNPSHNLTRGELAEIIYRSEQ